MTRPFMPKAFAMLAMALGHSGACSSEPLGGVPVDTATARPIAVAGPKAGRDRHLVAVLAGNAGTETTDFMVPYGILRESGAANVTAVSTHDGPVKLMPALKLHLDRTIEEFDRQHPAGADIVIVPAMHRADDPVVIQWLRRQSETGAMVVGVCDGVLVVARAGLLDGRRATGHWYSMRNLRRNYPKTVWVPDRRYVADEQVITTTGVAASIPVSLALIEALGGEAIARYTARVLGVASYGPEHDSSAFGMSAGAIVTALGNAAKFWGHERIALPVEDGVDEIALALAADAWSRTWRSEVVTVNAEQARVSSKRGLIIEVDDHEAVADHSIRLGSMSPAGVLDRTLVDISHRYGERTAAFVALQLEHPARLSPSNAGGAYCSSNAAVSQAAQQIVVEGNEHVRVSDTTLQVGKEALHPLMIAYARRTAVGRYPPAECCAALGSCRPGAVIPRPWRRLKDLRPAVLLAR